MNAHKLVGNLTLRHSDITPDPSLTAVNSFGRPAGYFEKGKQSTYWNVNLRTLLGNEYEHGGLYSIQLSQFAYTGENTWFDSFTTENSLSNFTMQGLGDWVNCAYDPATQRISPRYTFLTHQILNATPEVKSFPPNISTGMFRIRQEQVEINIELFRATDNVPTSYLVTPIPHMIYNFKIYKIST